MVAYVIVPGIDGSDEDHWQSRWEHGWGASAARIRPSSWTEPDLEDWVTAVGTAYETVVSRWDEHDEHTERRERDEHEERVAHDEHEERGDRNEPVVLVAHSLGCWAAAEWLGRARPDGITAFLVAPPDPRGPAFPAEAAPAFLDLSARPLPCRSLVVAGEDDRYCDPATSAALARGWRSPLHLVGGAGHINSASGLGDWPAGRSLLRTLTEDTEPTRPR